MRVTVKLKEGFTLKYVRVKEVCIEETTPKCKGVILKFQDNSKDKFYPFSILREVSKMEDRCWVKVYTDKFIIHREDIFNLREFLNKNNVDISMCMYIYPTKIDYKSISLEWDRGMAYHEAIIIKETLEIIFNIRLIYVRDDKKKLSKIQG